MERDHLLRSRDPDPRFDVPVLEAPHDRRHHRHPGGHPLVDAFYSSMERPADQISAAVVIGGPFVLAGMLLILYAVVIQPRRSDDTVNP